MGLESESVLHELIRLCRGYRRSIWGLRLIRRESQPIMQNQARKNMELEMETGYTEGFPSTM